MVKIKHKQLRGKHWTFHFGGKLNVIYIRETVSYHSLVSGTLELVLH